MSSFPDYYKLLNVSTNATQEEIRKAYRKESLRTHPDRSANASPEERREATEKFQSVADAYYVLSDPVRRRDYDTLYATRPQRTADPAASSSFFSQFANYFSNSNGAAGGANTAADTDTNGTRPNANNVFADVFEEMLQPEVERHAPWWSYLGAACGGGIGFIVANIPGLVLGAAAGNRLGAIRDAKGKSVAAVFQELGATQKAEILRALAVKILGSAL